MPSAGAVAAHCAGRDGRPRRTAGRVFIMQLCSARKTPHRARPPPANNPTVPAAYGLGSFSSVAHVASELSILGTGVDLMRSFHLIDARVVAVVMFGCKGSPPDQVLSRSPYSSAKRNAEWPSSWMPIRAAVGAVENQATVQPAPPYCALLMMTTVASTSGTCAFAVSLASVLSPERRRRSVPFLQYFASKNVFGAAPVPAVPSLQATGSSLRCSWTRPPRGRC